MAEDRSRIAEALANLAAALDALPPEPDAARLDALRVTLDAVADLIAAESGSAPVTAPSDQGG